MTVNNVAYNVIRVHLIHIPSKYFNCSTGVPPKKKRRVHKSLIYWRILIIYTPN
jgi:hypothetical protein